MPITRFDHQNAADLVIPTLRNTLNTMRSPGQKKVAFYFVLDVVLPALKEIARMPLDEAQAKADAIEPHDL